MILLHDFISNFITFVHDAAFALAGIRNKPPGLCCRCRCPYAFGSCHWNLRTHKIARLNCVGISEQSFLQWKPPLPPSEHHNSIS